MKITIWNEFRRERAHEAARAIYPEGIHMHLASVLKGPGRAVATATLDDPACGLSEAVLNATDVLIWWAHVAHDEIDDSIVDRVQRRVLDGMGLVMLHSSHESKVFRRLMGTSTSIAWRQAPGGERERVWTINPSHPIAAGIGPYIELPAHEMYGEPFDIPEPDELVFLSWFEGGDVFRSGCCFRRGRGRIFYFSPGHETFPIYMDPQIQRVVQNAAEWAAGTGADRASVFAG